MAATMSRKEAILNTAAHLFAEKGFGSTSMGELSKITGVAQGTIFYHFKNKEALFLSILESLKDEIIGQFDNHFSNITFKNGLEMIEGAISFFLELAGSMEDRFLLLHRHDAYEIAKENPDFRHHLEAIYTCLVDFFERAIRLGQEDGSIEEFPARKNALLILSMVDGLVRFNTYKLYHGGALYEEVIASCRRMLEKNPKEIHCR
jgi:AcrR family transcriptional regulator